MKSKYYLGYIINPNEIITSDFEERKKLKCILIYDEGIYTESITDAKFFPVQERQVIDGKKVFDDDASLVGIVDKELEIDDIINFEMKNDITEYVKILIELIGITRQFAIKGKKDYLAMENEFIKTFSKRKINNGRKN